MPFTDNFFVIGDLHDEFLIIGALTNEIHAVRFKQLDEQNRVVALNTHKVGELKLDNEIIVINDSFLSKCSVMLDQTTGKPK